jgi:tellurium resistance protein TerZ
MGVSLEKGQKVSLSKEAGGALTKAIMGLGWDAGMQGGQFGGSVDLDASCVMFDENKKIIDTVWFRHLSSNDGSVVHSGDNLTGDGKGDDEQIIVNLDKVPPAVKALIFTVSSFSGQTFDAIENAYCRMLDASNNKEIARYTLKAQGSHSAQIMAKVYRHNNEWKMHAIGESGNGRTIEALLPQIIIYL